jgi:GT2 family glycosyltransferase
LKNNDSKLGIVGFKFFNPDGTFQPSAGNFPTLLRIIFDRIPILRNNLGIQIRNESFYKKPGLVDWVSGSGFLVAKNAYQKIRGMDEKIFMYGEDFDLCFRLEKEGFKNFFYPGIRIMHYDSGKNIPEKKPFKYFAMRKGFSTFLKKYSAKENLSFYRVFVKLEAILFLTILPFRGYNSDIKFLWRTHLLKSLSRI